MTEEAVGLNAGKSLLWKGQCVVPMGVWVQTDWCRFTMYVATCWLVSPCVFTALLFYFGLLLELRAPDG